MIVRWADELPFWNSKYNFGRTAYGMLGMHVIDGVILRLQQFVEMLVYSPLHAVRE